MSQSLTCEEHEHRLLTLEEIARTQVSEITQASTILQTMLPRLDDRLCSVVELLTHHSHQLTELTADLQRRRMRNKAIVRIAVGVSISIAASVMLFVGRLVLAALARG
jgi:hypothetical protein